MAEPVLRTTIPAAAPEAPTGAGFSNSFGVMRYQVGSAADAQDAVRLAAEHRQAEQAKPATFQAGVGHSTAVPRSTMTGGEIPTETPGLLQGNPADLRPADGGIVSTARTQNGRPLAGNEIKGDSV